MFVMLQYNIDLEAGLVNGSQGEIVGFEEFRDVEALMEARYGQDRKDDFKESQLREFARRNISRDPTMPNHPGAIYLPRVRFNDMRDSADPRRKMGLVIFPECMMHAVSDDEPFTYICRTQIPLAPAWAVTIHKSQGMSLDRVVVDPTDVFEKGQIYVALSRARTLQGLKVLGGHQALDKKLGVNEEVLEFLQGHGLYLPTVGPLRQPERRTRR